VVHLYKKKRNINGIKILEENFLNKPIRVFSCPLNQDTSAAGLA